MKRFLTGLLVACICLTFVSVACASCMSAWMEIWDAGTPLQGYDSATTYLKASKCNNGIHNEFRVRVTLTNSDGSTVRKTSTNYVNATGTKSSGEAKAMDRNATKAVGAASGKCNICGQNWGNGTSYKTISTRYFKK